MLAEGFQQTFGHVVKIYADPGTCGAGTFKNGIGNAKRCPSSLPAVITFIPGLSKIVGLLQEDAAAAGSESGSARNSPADSA